MTFGRLSTAVLAALALSVLFASCGNLPVRGLPFFVAEGPVAHHDVALSTNPYHNSVDVTDHLYLAPELLSHGKLQLALSPAAEVEAVLDGDDPLPHRVVDAPAGWPQGAVAHEIDLARNTRSVTVRLTVTLTRSDGLPGAISSSGAFLPAEALWYPQRPGERATYRWSVVTESEWEVACVGHRTHHSVEGSTQRQGWEAEVPLPGLDLAAAPFTAYTLESDLEVAKARAYFLGDHDALADVWLNAAERQLDHMNLYLGRFPTDHFTLVEVPDYVLTEAPWRMFGGVALSSRTLVDAISPDQEVSRAMFDTRVGWSEAREDQGDWRPAARAWLESEAPSGLPLPPGSSERREAWLRDWREGRNPADERPLIEAGPLTPVRVGRGAMVLHMLSHWIAPADFQQGLRNAAATGTGWSDLRAGMERATQKNLGWFFDPWLTRLGAPRLTLQGVEPMEVSVAGRTAPAVKVKVSRDGFSAPVMVPIVAELSGGRVVQWLPFDSAVGEVVIPLAPLSEKELASLDRGRVPPPLITAHAQASQGGGGERDLGTLTSVRVDAEFDVLRELYPEELLPRMGDVLKDPQVPVLAGEGLNLVEDATLVAALMGRRTISPTALNAEAPRSVVAVARWSAVNGSRVQVGPLSLGLPRDLKVQGELLWHRVTPYATAQVTAVLAVPHPRDPSRTVLLFLTHSEKDLSEVVPYLSMAHQAGFMVFSGKKPVARGRYEPGPNPLMELMGVSDGPRLDEPAAW